MKRKLALLLAMLALALSGCGYVLVEDSPVQLGGSVVEMKSAAQ